ncbi:PucR family transcriptional regulator [Nocardia asteroides]|uniref:CdaR family transcriptional regulator n=1 Tax=Nocardia asteroides NBRC 15531 TaxID=1110697 RepID=U5EA21_NOCAS|nr:helix-turn-helix domain-containing protein [Nocardia asteroides]GAD84190.1 putative CdaR family transcriptional regulator [Nocardia asteroides NBRC 15531]SFN32157.1 PucR C-terminal helix-turn-helix domain-containing protein [Nocardia asteroides]VEG36541.1 carbohydrate diacid transcriptional activator CdaR [Nocardia asteroides]
MMTLPVDDTTMWQPLRDVRTLTGRLVAHFVDTVATCRTLPGDAISGDVTAVTRLCLEIVGGTLDGREETERLNRLSVAAAGWAREGVPIDAILHAFHEGFRLGYDAVFDTAAAGSHADLVDGFRRAVAISDLLCTTVTRAYIQEHRDIAGEHHTAVHTLTSALLAGQPTVTMARECGIAVADAYSVLALAIRRRRGTGPVRGNAAVAARRALRRVQAALAQHGGDQVLSLLSVDGGTLLIPAGLLDADGLDALVAQLSRAADVAVTAALVPASTEEIPSAAERAHELLDMVERLDCAPGLYRFGDLALEYQLTRPGPGRARLGELLAPLDGHPELFQTLRVHIANNMNRRRTARLLHIHTNTVDYRLRRIAQLTGLDPTQGSGLWQLRSAMIARSFHTGPTPEARLA